MRKSTCVDEHTFKLNIIDNRNVNDIESASKELVKYETELSPRFLECR